MWLARIGGLFVIGGWALLIAGLAGEWAVGQTVSGAVMTASAPPIALGASLMAIGGGRPLDGHRIRAGLGLIAVGLACVAISPLVGGSDGFFSTGILPTLILTGGGGLAMVIGVLVTGVGLVRTPGRPRLIGGLFFGGLAVALLSTVLGEVLPGESLRLAMRSLVIGGAAGFALGATGLGLLAVTGDRPGQAAS